MPSQILNRLNAQEARTRLQEATGQLQSLRARISAATREARSFTSQDYTAEGLERERETRVQRVRDRFGPELQQLQSRVRTDHEDIANLAAANRPRLGEDAVSLQRAQMKWDGVKARLDAGMPLPRILSSADLDTALAIREWAPAWLEARAYQTRPSTLGLSGDYVAPDTEALFRSVDDRLAEVAGGDAASFTTWAREANIAAASFGPLSEHTSSMLVDDRQASGTALQAAVAAQLASQAAQVGLPDDDGADASNGQQGEGGGASGAA